MIDKLKKIAELAPELLGYLNTHMDNLEAWLDTPDRQWMLIGRIVDDLFGNIDNIVPEKPLREAKVLYYKGSLTLTSEAPTLLEAVCDAWLSLRGGD